VSSSGTLTSLNVGIGVTDPQTQLHIVGKSSSNPAIMRIDQPTDGFSSLTNVNPGLELIARGMNSTLRYTPAIKFMSSDTNFTTQNPRFLASIVGRATEAYNNDSTTGRMSIDFLTTDTNPGADSSPETRMTINGNGNVGIGTTNPTSRLHVRGSSGDENTTTLLLNGPSTGPKMLMIHADSGNSTSDVQAGIGFSNHTGSSFASQSIGSLRRGTNGFGDLLFMLRNNSEPNEVTTADEKMRITANGNVGIGVTNPVGKFEVLIPPGLTNFASQSLGSLSVGNATSASGVIVPQLTAKSNAENRTGLFITSGTNNTNSGVDMIFDVRDTSNAAFTTLTTRAFQFQTNNSPLMTVLRNGNVGIGVTNPSEKLVVAGNVLIIEGLLNLETSVDGVNSQMILYSNSTTNSTGFTTRRGRGTSENPLAVETDDVMFAVYSRAHNGTDFANSNTGAIRILASEDHTETAAGTKIDFRTTPNGSTSFVNSRMVIDHNGNVGIGTVSPSQKLHVIGNVLADNVSVPSDTRIKIDIAEIQDGNALYKLRLIEPHEYNYVDKESRGDHRVFGFLAQQVREHFPEAINLMKAIIPDVNKVCPVDLEEHTILLGTQARDGKLQIRLSNRTLDLQVTKVDDERVVYTPEDLEENIEIPSEVFVVGYEVDDFHTLNKDFLFTINFAATQELDRVVQNQKAEMESQKAEMESQKAEMEDLKLVNDDLMLQNMSLKNRVSELESQLSSLLTALTDKGIL
jgi:hypothetical protein